VVCECCKVFKRRLFGMQDEDGKRKMISSKAFGLIAQGVRPSASLQVA
jgi:hypothetical protein